MEHPNLCTNMDAITDNGSMRAEHPDCEYCEERPPLLQELKRQLVVLKIDKDLVEATNLMWRRRFGMACFILAAIIGISLLFWS
jgi:hypothetical protein